LRELEHRYRDTLVIIGVHSAKFPTEREHRHLAAAVQRLELDHPVVNDRDFVVWQGYAVRAWPTLMFVDPQGKVIGKHEGEFTLDTMTGVIDAMLAEFEAAGLLAPAPPPVSQPASRPATLLAFPGKVVADAATDRLYIADTNHKRIVVATTTGDIVRVYRDREAGLKDGSAAHARFNHPQGLALGDGALFVADTDNHAIRRVDLASDSTTTIAGTGQQAQRYLAGGPALATDLTSPWDVVVVGDTLFIAMAGNHQLWRHRLGSDEVRRYAGSGHEGLRDGAIASSWLAQPSGLTRMGDALLFTDSETSSLRVAALPELGDGQVRTLIGEDLFEFGDRDGGRATARLQHPLGVAYDATSGVAYVADTYNNKIKRLDPRSGQIESWLGDAVSGHSDGVGAAVRFFEPAGLSVAGAALYIADTNNHAIRRAELASGEVRTLEVGPES